MSNVVLDAGSHVMRLAMDSNSTNGGDIGNFNYLQAILTLSNNPPSVALTAPPNGATFATDTVLPITATASDSGGSIARVDFLANGNLIGAISSAPYNLFWTNVPANNYLLMARAVDNIGNATLSASRSIKVIAGQAPFIGVPFNVPGTIQAEDFDGGGEGAAYHDTDASNNGGQYRAGAVDIENCSDSGGGYDIGWTSAGEWLEYTINAVVDGQYTLQIRTASSGNAGNFHIEVDGVNKTGTITNTDSGGWQAWRTLSKTIGLTAGSHTMRLALDSNGANGTVGNFNYFTFIAFAANAPPVLAHRYSFEGAPGSTLVADSVGTADGTAIGGASFTGDGRLTLNGVNGYVDLPNGIISSLTNVSLETWVKWNGGSQWQRLFDFGSNSGGENGQGTGQTYLALTPRSSADLLRFMITTNSSGGQSVLTGTSMLPTNQMVHLAIVYDFIGGTSELFLNGQRLLTGAAPIPIMALNDINNWLGRSQWNDPYFNGQFEEFRIYNGALTDLDIATSYAAGPDALYAGAPSLAALRNGAVVTLSWPLSAPGFALESSPNLFSTWSTVTNPVALSNRQHLVTVPLGGTNAFYRLRR